MAENCKLCGRPRKPASGSYVVHDVCSRPNTDGCLHAQAGRRVGLRQGVEIAKEHAWVDLPDTRDIDFTDVNVALEEALKP